MTRKRKQTAEDRRRLMERQKDYDEKHFGVRPDIVLDATADDADWIKRHDEFYPAATLMPELGQILESKRALRRRLAMSPLQEKLAMLDALRDRLRAIKSAKPVKKAASARGGAPSKRK